MNIKAVVRYIGMALLFNALFMFLSVLVSVLNDFDSAFSPLLLSAVITAMVGGFPLIFVRKSENLNTAEGFLVTALAWVLCCVFDMLPYVLWGGVFSLSNAWYESVSGLTTTGGTILADVESLPKSLIFWRSSTHFIGGIGVVVFVLLVLPTVSSFGLKISKMQISSLSMDNYRYKSRDTVKVIMLTYFGITLLSFVFLLLAGMNAFDAVNHAMSIVSTGGFSTKNLSIMHYDSFPIELVCNVFMFISALHFGLIYAFFVDRSTKLFRSPVTIYYTGYVIVASLFVALSLKFGEDPVPWGKALRDSFFQVISLSSTTGFATADTSRWPLFAILILVFTTLQGACSGSTAGGIKTDRILIFFKAIKAQIVKQLHPQAVVRVKSGNSIIDESTVSSVALFIVLYLLIVFVIGLMLSLTGLDFVDSMSASMAAMSNCGPGFGNCNSLANYDFFTPFGKFLLGVEMLLGRLEIYGFLVLLILRKR